MYKMAVIRVVISISLFTFCIFCWMHGYHLLTDIGEHDTSHDKISKVSPPNFVIFLADDIGWGDLGVNWEPNKDVTPNLNQLAGEGLRLTNFHAGASVCTPSRASLLTGRLGLRTGVVKNFRQNSVGGLPLNETTLAEALHVHGYHTGMIGKWHLGITHKYHPRSRGFDFYYGLPWSNDMGCVDVKVYNHPECKTCPKLSGQDFNKSTAIPCPNFFTALPLYNDYDIIEQPVDLNQLGDNYVAQAQTFIQMASKLNKPFLLYMPFAHMHVPLAHASRFTNSTSVKTIYGDTLHELDDIVGRVVKTLKSNGVYNNTLTWFTGDNGPWRVKCQYSGSQGPFLGSWLRSTYGGGTTGKMTSWEGGHREPTIVVWPGVVEPNTTSDALTSALDIFPTVLSAAGSGLPSGRNYDGIDLTSLFQNQTQDAHSWLFHPNSGDTLPAGEIDVVRIGQYKVFWKTGGVQPDCSGDIAPQVTHDPPLVFDLDRDIAESSPLTEESTPDLKQIIAEATLHRQNLLDDIKKDNTSKADYSTSPFAIPCCDPHKFYCRCKRDTLV